MDSRYVGIGVPNDFYIVMSVIGDSISVSGNRWPDKVRDRYNDGRITLKNHAVSGAAILHVDGQTDMDDEVLAAVNDAADLIFIELGTNGGYSQAMQDEYQENINELLISNPHATIYAMGVLPRADPTDNGRVEKNIRILAAANNAGVTYWDTDGWINPTAGQDTSDGLHLNDSGHEKVTTEVLNRLP